MDRDLPRDADVQRLIARGDEAELHAVWDTYASRRSWAQIVERARDQGHAEHEQVAEQALAELPEVSALDALAANRRLVELLTGRRWYVMQAARETGASWTEIGAALGMTKQGAQDAYRRKIADQERWVPDLHDTDRARAALDTGN